MLMQHVTLRIRPGMADIYEGAFLELQSEVVAHEPGCIMFELCRDGDEPHVYHVFEAYRDAAAIEAHVAAPHYAPSARVFVECLAGDHMAEINRRGLTGRAMYSVVTGMTAQKFETI